MKYIQGGADIEQVDFTNIQVKNLYDAVTISAANEVSSSYIFPKEKLKGLLILRGVAVGADVLFKLQEKQNGAWVTMPNTPSILINDSIALAIVPIQINNFKEIRLIPAFTDTSGDASGTLTLTADLLV